MHKLTNIRPELKLADCSTCGLEIAIKRKFYGDGRTGWGCRKRIKEQKIRNEQLHPEALRIRNERSRTNHPKPSRRRTARKTHEQKLETKREARKRSLERLRANPEKHSRYVRDKHLRRQFKITLVQCQALLAIQGFRCAGCGDPLLKPQVDHDHRCCALDKSCGNCIRGLLCRICNSSLGITHDNPIRLPEYLRAYLLKPYVNFT